MQQGKIYQRNGYRREVLSERRGMVHVKTVGTPAYKAAGRPPVSGIIEVASFEKWLKNKKNKQEKVQLTI